VLLSAARPSNVGNVAVREKKMTEASETKVIFEAEQVSGNWRLKCLCPNGVVEYVTGFNDEQSIRNWLASEHKDAWLKARRYEL
jgi:hypothetical protein